MPAPMKAGGYHDARLFRQKEHLAIRWGSGMAISRLRKHRTFTKQLAEFAEKAEATRP